MVRINQDRFDSIISNFMKDCKNISEANCDSCPMICVLYQELRDQNIDQVPDILNTLRLLFLDEIVLRTNAMKTCPRFEELSPKEFSDIMSNQNHYFYDRNGNLYAIY
jgi:hypothetical protein